MAPVKTDPDSETGPSTRHNAFWPISVMVEGLEYYRYFRTSWFLIFVAIEVYFNNINFLLKKLRAF